MSSNERPSPKPGRPHVREYRLQDVRLYDELRYAGPFNQYKQTVMRNAYRTLIGSLADKRVLDVGCGPGRGAVDFAREARFTVGTDASLDMLHAARGKLSEARSSFVAGYAQALPFGDGSFDVVTALNFLHLFRVETQRAMIDEMKRVARPGGLLVLEFDNALHGLGIGLYKRWRHLERGSMPWELRRAIGDGCSLISIYGAVIPVVWRVFYRFPRLFSQVEKVAYLPLWNRLSHRVYYKLRVGRRV